LIATVMPGTMVTPVRVFAVSSARIASVAPSPDRLSRPAQTPSALLQRMKVAPRRCSASTDAPDAPRAKLSPGRGCANMFRASGWPVAASFTPSMLPNGYFAHMASFMPSGMVLP
jgi:hypothetical protein